MSLEWLVIQSNTHSIAKTINITNRWMNTAYTMYSVPGPMPSMLHSFYPYSAHLLWSYPYMKHESTSSSSMPKVTRLVSDREGWCDPKSWLSTTLQYGHNCKMHTKFWRLMKKRMWDISLQVYNDYMLKYFL